MDLADSLKACGFDWGRLKTGTPPRLDRSSIDFDRAVARGEFQLERGDDPPVAFSFLTRRIECEQIDCYLLHTNERVRDLVRANIHLKVGDPYNPNATTDDIRTLKATGYFYNIQVAVERTDGGVKLIYVVQGQPVLSDVRFEGNRKYSNSKLLKKVKSKIGEPLDDYKLFSDAQELKKLYEKAGYQQTRVEARQSINLQLGRATVTFEIKETPKVRIVDVQFVSAQAFSQRKLRKQLKTRRHWMFSWLTGSGKLK